MSKQRYRSAICSSNYKTRQQLEGGNHEVLIKRVLIHLTVHIAFLEEASRPEEDDSKYTRRLEYYCACRVNMKRHVDGLQEINTRAPPYLV